MSKRVVRPARLWAVLGGLVGISIIPYCIGILWITLQPDIFKPVGHWFGTWGAGIIAVGCTAMLAGLLYVAYVFIIRSLFNWLFPREEQK